MIKFRSSLAAIILALCAGPVLAADARPGVASVVVDYKAAMGALPRTERYNNFSSAGGFPEQRADDVTFFNEQGLHGSVYRVWIRDDYDASTGVYAPSPATVAYLDAASRISDRLLVNLFNHRPVEKDRTPEQLKAMAKTVIKTLKVRYPKVKYIEVFNEPDWQRHKDWKPEEYYRHYKSFYEAVNEINAELKPKDPLEVGGPALAFFDLPWLAAFFDGYKADPSPAKRIDFISYHAYGAFKSFEPTQFMMFRSDPSQVASQRGVLDEMLRSRGLSDAIPSFITETGMYPGPSFDEKEGKGDYLRSAAGMASLYYWYMGSPKNVPFNWVMRHPLEERKDQLITRGGEGKAPPLRTFTPYGNLLLMFSKMKTTRIAAASDGVLAGQGVYALAARDDAGVSLMLWNYQSVNERSFTTQVKLDNLPPALTRGGKLRERVWRIDATTSNYWGNPAKANLQLVSERTLDAKSGVAATRQLTPNAIELIVLDRAP